MAEENENMKNRKKEKRKKFKKTRKTNIKPGTKYKTIRKSRSKRSKEKNLMLCQKLN